MVYCGELEDDEYTYLKRERAATVVATLYI